MAGYNPLETGHVSDSGEAVNASLRSVTIPSKRGMFPINTTGLGGELRVVTIPSKRGMFPIYWQWPLWGGFLVTIPSKRGMFPMVKGSKMCYRLLLQSPRNGACFRSILWRLSSVGRVLQSPRNGACFRFRHGTTSVRRSRVTIPSKRGMFPMGGLLYYSVPKLRYNPLETGHVSDVTSL